MKQVHTFPSPQKAFRNTKLPLDPSTGKPSLLVHRLPDEAEPLTSQEKFAVDGLSVWSASKGSGKLRSVFECMCSNYAFFLTGDESPSYGLADLTAAWSEVKKLEGEVTLERVNGIYNKLLLTRHLVLEKYLEAEHCTPKGFLFIQLYKLRGQDIFSDVYDALKSVPSPLIASKLKELQEKLQTTLGMDSVSVFCQTAEMAYGDHIELKSPDETLEVTRAPHDIRSSSHLE